MRVIRREVAFGRYQNDSNPLQKDGTISSPLFYVIFATLVLTNVLTLVGFLMAPDISRMIGGQNERIFAAYEDRIAQLRVEVDRLYSRQYAQSGNLNLQLIELSQQQAALSEIHPFVKALAAKAQELGIDDIAGFAGNDIGQPLLSGAAKPDMHDSLVTGSIDQMGSDKQLQINRLETSINELTAESHMALKILSNAANRSTETILSELSIIGVTSPGSAFDETATGGPFIPVGNSDDMPSLVDEANAVASSFDRFTSARSAIRSAPVLMPLKGKFRLSSAYGSRKDPFGRQKAFHSGNDFAAPWGDVVRSAGAGIVVFTGRKGGYGIAVEIKHDNGLLTRYAHLSSSLVSVGQTVNAGEAIAKVGSTGRSTGPHLHFEVRNDEGTLNPHGFLQAGNRLARFM